MTSEPSSSRHRERVRRFVRERDWEFAFKRAAMMLVLVPSGLLIIESADSDGPWWPWALTGASWVVLVTTGSVLFWVRMIKRGHW